MTKIEYWTHRNGQTAGPFGHDVIVDLGDPEVLVSHGKEWISFSEHPDFKKPETKGTYFISENGATVGPLTGAEVISRVMPETLVSNEGAWTRADEHPEFRQSFSNQPGAVSEVASTNTPPKYWIRQDGETQGPLTKEEILQMGGDGTFLVSHGDEWVLMAEHPDFRSSTTADQTVGGIFDKGMALAGGIGLLEPNPKKPGHQRPNPKGWIAILGCGVPIGFVSLLFFLGLLIGVSEEQGSTTVRSPPVSELDTAEGSGDVVNWADSFSFDLAAIATYVDTYGPDHYLQNAREILQRGVSNNIIVRVEGSTAWVTKSDWENLTRANQKSIVLNLAVLDCGCLTPTQWQAAVRDASSNELLITISDDGLQALWTPEGYSVASDDRADPRVAETRVSQGGFEAVFRCGSATIGACMGTSDLVIIANGRSAFYGFSDALGLMKKDGSLHIALPTHFDIYLKNTPFENNSGHRLSLVILDENGDVVYEQTAQPGAAIQVQN